MSLNSTEILNSEVMPLERRKGRRRWSIIPLLINEALTAKEVAEKIGIKENNAHKRLRYYEKLGELVALNYKGRIHYLEKKSFEKLNVEGETQQNKDYKEGFE